ncbi:hypothetical protein MGMO_92c00480 [Methyloglobulus morosus KoM1]|uniref:DUF3570 domain-containing protein n=1 Tax=Methyloglobulus morosus KoM1 TaxID=1116472 RepID=V5DWN2_9GAMM|nr:hypothetical protein MGMO_92c00480 [Methyloglobulus morosus KoM1]
MQRKEAVVVAIKASKGNGHKLPENASLLALTSAALVLPGLFSPLANAAETDEVDFQYSHYQEGKRSISSGIIDPVSGDNTVAGIKNTFNPIEVDSLHGHANVTLTDRIKFAFNYTQDTWGGATPIATAPAVFGGNAELVSADGLTVVGATPYLQGFNQVLLDSKLNPVQFATPFDPTSGLIRNNQLSHTLATASPETRKQGDFKLTYEWDEVALSGGGGISVEDDYESRFGNIGGRWDLNQKRTTLNLDLSYTNSDTHATLNHDTLPYIDIKAYDLRGQIDTLSSVADAQILHGNRQDWGTHFGVSQVLNKDALMSADVSYTRSTGYMANPYKAVSVVFIDPGQQTNAPPGGFEGRLKALLEQRPDERNQWNLGGRYVQYLHNLDAALHFDYRFSADDWGIQAHTFEADWVQPLGSGWTVTPRVRYYSQDAADFYTPWLVSQQAYKQKFDAKGHAVGLSYDPGKLPANFSSDQRLSGFGALSGGISVTKRFAKGLSLETGFEYYTHQGSFKIGGGGEGSYADFDYWVANAALKVDLAALSLGGGSIANAHAGHTHFDHGGQAPAGVMFSHMLHQAGDFMVGYRYMYGNQSGNMLHGTDPVSDQAIVANGCGLNPCFLRPGSMTMHMHMLDLMYAPTDWLTLMLMPQFVDMSMSMGALNGAPDPQTVLDFNLSQHIPHHIQSGHETGGIGDLGMYAMFKLFDKGIHHVHATAGLSAPTGDVDIQLARNHQVDGGFIDYGMQLGSGTWDFKPSLTYTGQLDQLSWGTQANGIVRMDSQNKSGYALGNLFQATAWGGYNLTHWLIASVRGIYTLQDSIQGQFNGRINQFGPMDYPSNYGGQYWDVGFGLSAVVPSGDLAGNRLSVEWLQPVEDKVNGYQLERDGALSATWSVMF